MDITPEEIQTLSILDAIEGNHRVSQRELSKTTGLNLAKVNFLLRRLAERGQVKLRNISKSPNKLRYLYILTPHGLAEKSRLTLRFAARSLREYSRTLDLIRQSLSRLTETGVQRIVLLGVTDITDLIIEASPSIPNLTIVGIVAHERAGGSRQGIPMIKNVDGISYDRAIPCDDIDIHNPHAATWTGIPHNKIWLM